jgi:hypothetical protein
MWLIGLRKLKKHFLSLVLILCLVFTIAGYVVSNKSRLKLRPWLIFLFELKKLNLWKGRSKYLEIFAVNV